jgi:DNA-binding NtrC family response regulator
MNCQAALDLDPPRPAAPDSSPALRAIVGQDPGLRDTLARAARVAPTRTPVLVTGESGTGKELLARALHDLGGRPDGPFVAVNCGALSRELAESELFGHERGSFTGAAGRRAGWFEEASGGTLVLDEIGELPLDLQPKLLRVLETGRLRRVGGSGEIAVDVRVVAMTLRDLRREALRGTFRIDLFHRLAGFELTLPPLRRRPGDLAPLVRHFLDELRPEVGLRTMSPGALSRLARHDWPGNVRELRNVVRRAAILSSGTIEEPHLELDGGADGRWADRVADEGTPVLAAAAPPGGGGWPPAPGPPIATGLPGAGPWSPSPPAGGGHAGPGGDYLDLRGKTWDEIERETFSWALRRTHGSRRRAAALLGICRSTFCDRVRRMGLLTTEPEAPRAAG